MVNPFKPGDKVSIQRKGVEHEAVVRTTFNHEVQVRVADGELLWRTVKTARLIQAAEPASDTPEAPQEPGADQAPAESSSAPEAPEEVAEGVPSGEAAEVVAQESAPEAETAPAEAETVSEPVEGKGSKKARKRARGLLNRMLTKGPFIF